MILAGRDTTGELLAGNEGNDTIRGGLGNDHLYGGPGANLMMGGKGDDSYFVDHIDDVMFERERWEPVGFGNIVSTTIDYSLEGLAVEVLILNGSATQGTGIDLSNRIVGSNGNNSLNGRTGDDTLTGGTGADGFFFSDVLGAQHADTIVNFTPIEGRIVINSGRVNTGPGTLDAAVFHLGSEATTADHRFVFDGATLRYDADGSGAGIAVDVAYFEGTPVLTADDIFVA